MAIPGAGWQFIADPDNASAASQMSDMATLNLQMLHIVRAGLQDDGLIALADQVAARSQQVLDASKVSHSREAATRELKPLTRVPHAPWGPSTNIAQIRMHNIPAYTGTSADVLDVVRWLSRVLALASAHTLTYDAAINLMIQGSSGGAADYIEQMKDEGKTIFQVVQLLEMRYGNLCTPEEARVKTNSMARGATEGLSEFIDRLRAMARMACRLQADEVIRRQEIENLVEGNIRRALPTSVRNALSERVVTRSSMGLPAFTAREVEKECLDLERRRDERKSQITGASKPRGQIHRLETVCEADSSDDSNSSADEAEYEDVGTYHLINEIKQVQQKYARKGKVVDTQRVFRKAFNKYNNRYPVKPQQYGARQVGQGGNAQNNPNQNQGPPNTMEGQQRRTIMELLALANIQKGSCVQCGKEGHFMRSDACALRDKALVDRACAKCGKGLHQADDCPTVYQRQYVANPQAANLINLPQDPLNED